MKLIRIHCHTETEGKIAISELEFPPALLEKMADLGIIQPERGYIAPAERQRIYKILRLRRCLGVNLVGASIIVELLERMEEMQEEINKLRKQGR